MLKVRRCSIYEMSWQHLRTSIPIHDAGKDTHFWTGKQISILKPKPTKNYSIWLILRTRLANRTPNILESYRYCNYNILPKLGRVGRRLEYAGCKQLYTQFTLTFPCTVSNPNSNQTIQTTPHARDFLDTATTNNKRKGYTVAPMDHLSMSRRFLGRFDGFATPTL